MATDADAGPDDAPGDGTTITDEERTWAIVAHLAAFAVFVIPVIGNILGPLAV